MKRVLVTGGAGFIGSHIVEELVEKNYKVLVLDNFSTGRQENINHPVVDVFEYDITDPDVIDVIVSLRPDYIIHQAAQVSVAESVQNPLHDENVNVKGSLHVIEAAVRAGVKKVVFASSAAVYGEPEFLPITTRHPALPESPYGLTKLTVEHYLNLNSKLHQVSYSILRYSNVYGPRQDAKGEGGVVAIFADRLAEGISPFIFGDGRQTRDFIYVKDVAAANIKAMLAEENVCLNVSTGSSICINELLCLMQEAAGTKLKAVYDRERPGDIRHSVLDNEETKAKLDWEPNCTIMQGLRETIDFIKKRNKMKIG
jgi:UDP-glucose 4-epimerase